MSEGSRLYFDAYLAAYRHEFLRVSGQRTKVQEVISILIRDGCGRRYKIKSWKTMLFIMPWFGFIAVGAKSYLLGWHQGHKKEWTYFPDTGKDFVLQLNPYLWPTIAVSFEERGVAKITHFNKDKYHEDLYALLQACDNNATVTMTFL